MYFLCHSCGKKIGDDGRNLTIKCANCGEINFSRIYQNSPGGSPPRVYSFNELKPSEIRRGEGAGVTENELEVPGEGHRELRPTRPPHYPPYPYYHPPPSHRDSPPPAYQYHPDNLPYPPRPTGHQPPYGSGWHGQYSSQFWRSRSPISLLVHCSVFLLLITLLMNVLSLGPALVEVARNANGSPGVGWIIFLVPYPPFIVSVDAFLYQHFGINVFLGSYSIVVYFIIIELAILLSCYYLFKRDGADLLCQLYNEILGKNIQHVSEIPFIGDMVKKHSPRERGERERDRERQMMQCEEKPGVAGDAWRDDGHDDGRSGFSTRPIQPPHYTGLPQAPHPAHPHHHTPPAWPTHPQVNGAAEVTQQPFGDSWYGPPSAPSSFFSNEDNRFGSEDNAIILTFKLFMVGVFINVIYNIITLLIFRGGVEEPEFLEKARFWQLAFSLARASVYEEVIARILLLGVPLYFFHRFFNKEAFERSNGVKNYLFGRGLEIDRWTLVLLFFSSVVFGLAHLEGWNIYKVVPTTIVGLTMGYLFIKKGLPASILLHFMFNYLSVPYQLFNPANVTIVFLGIVSLVSIITGMVLTLYYCVRTWNWLAELYNEKRKERRTGQWR